MNTQPSALDYVKNKETIAHDIVALLKDRCGGDLAEELPGIVSEEPQAALQNLTKSDLLRFLYLHDVSLSEVIPLNLSDAEIGEWFETMKQKGEDRVMASGGTVDNRSLVEVHLRVQILSELCRAPEPYDEERSARIRELRKKFSNIPRTGVK